MGKCLKVRKGDGIRIGDDVLIEVNQGSPHLFVRCPDDMRITLVRREDRFERPGPREKKHHRIVPPAALILVAALLMGGGCGDPAARTTLNPRVGDEAVSRPAPLPHVTLSGSLSDSSESVGSGLSDRREWAMIESVPWAASVDERDREPIEQPGLRVRVFRGGVVEVDTSGETPIGRGSRRAEPSVDYGVGL